MRRIIAFCILVVAVAAVTGPAQATPPSGVTGQILIRIPGGLFGAWDTVLQEITIQPGGHTGWHSHPGPAHVMVQAGTLSFYDGDDARCQPHRFSAGRNFVDPGLGHVHIGRNEGTEPVKLFVVYSLPSGAPPRTDAAAPGNCPF